jgi:hypothetical protein
MKNLLFSLIVISVISCSDTDDGRPATVVNIRIRNTSDFHYRDVYVNTSGGQHHYGEIDSNEASGYHEFDSAYSYAYVELKIGENLYKLQPIDYFGESKLENGYYTYEISAKSAGDVYDRLTLNLVVD